MMRSMEPMIDGLNISHRIGAGAQAVVYYATTPQQEPVAVKILTNLDQRERFFREYHVLKSLEHANLVRVFDSGTTMGQPYFVMEYVDGADILKHIKTRFPMGAKDPEWLTAVCALTTQICGVLEYFHQQGIIHRDLKPPNILVGKNGRVKLMDFGLIHTGEFSPLTQDNTLIGTVNYMSPEQLRHQDLDRRNDLYALGVILYQLAFGTLPYASDTLYISISNIINASPVRVNRTHLPDWFADLLENLLAKNTEERISDAGTVRRIIREGLDTAIPASHGEPAQKPLPILSTFVGRETELEMIRTCLGSGNGTTYPILAFSGMVGMGKSHLLKEAGALGREQGMTILSATCWPGSTPYEPFSDLMHPILSRLTDMPDDRCEAILGGCGKRLARVIRGFAELPAVQREPAPPILPWKVEKAEVSDAITGLLARFSKHYPLLIMLDNLEHADYATAEILMDLSLALEGDPRIDCRLILAGQTADLPRAHPARRLLAALGDRTPSCVMELKPLTEKQVAAFMRLAVPGNAQLRERTRTVFARSGGNPLFVKAMVEDLAHRDSPWNRSATDPDRTQMEVVRGEIQRALDELPRTQRLLLNALSVAGPLSTGEYIRHMTRLDADKITLDLAGLMRRNIIREINRSSPIRYSFVNSFVRNLVYEQLSASRKRTLHNRLLNDLERAGESPAPEDMAVHCLGARREADACAWLVKAAAQALNFWSPETARDHLLKAIEIIDTHESTGSPLAIDLRIETYRLASRVWNQLANFKESESILNRARREARDEHAENLYGEILIELGDLAVRQRSESTLLEYATEAQEIMTRIGSIQGQARCHNLLGIAASMDGRPQDSIRHFKQLSAMAETLDEPLFLATAYNNIGMIYSHLSQAEQAREFFNRSLAIRKSQGHLRDLAQSHGNLATLYKKTGDLRRATYHYLLACKYFRKCRDFLDSASSLSFAGEKRAQTGELARGLRMTKRAVKMVASFPRDSWRIIFIALAPAVILQSMGRIEEALQSFREIEQTVRETKAGAILPGFFAKMTHLLILNDQQDRAMEMLRSGILDTGPDDLNSNHRIFREYLRSRTRNYRPPGDLVSRLETALNPTLFPWDRFHRLSCAVEILCRNMRFDDAETFLDRFGPDPETIYPLQQLRIYHYRKWIALSRNQRDEAADFENRYATAFNAIVKDMPGDEIPRFRSRLAVDHLLMMGLML